MELLESYFSEKSLADSTRASYARVLRLFLAQVPDFEHCSAADLRHWLEGQGWGASLRYMAACCVRGFIRWRFGAHHPALRVRVRRERCKPGRVLSVDQVRRLMESHRTTTAKGRRDLAITVLALDTGLRVAEIAVLRAADVDLSARSLTVRIKGGKWATAVFSEFTASCLAAWYPFRVGGDDRLFQVSRDGLRVIVRRWGERLGFRLSPHDLRRTFAVMALRAGAPSRVVQVAGRWSSLDMVERYSQAITAADFEQYFPVSRVIDS